MIIYKMYNRITNKIYIGQTKLTLEQRVLEHLSERDCPVIYNALKKYGIQSFDISIIDIAETRKVLNEKEMYWITFYDCVSPKGYNLTTGGKQCEVSIFIKERLRSISRGRKHTLEVRRRMSKNRLGELNSNFGNKYKLSEATKRKMSECKMGEKHPMFNKTHSNETKEKMSTSQRGRKHTNESKEKMRRSHRLK